jgi:hypothetical protein
MKAFARLAALCGVTLFTGWIVFDWMQSLGVDSLRFALLLNFVLPMWILAVFVIASPDVTHPSLKPYFRSKTWEREGEIYSRLGVLRFQALLRPIGRHHIRGRDFQMRRDFALLKSLEQETKAAEAAHGACFVVVVLFAGYAALLGSIRGPFWLLSTGVFFQVYPMLLQRYHRPRYRRILAKMDETRSPSKLQLE